MMNMTVNTGRLLGRGMTMKVVTMAALTVVIQAEFILLSSFNKIFSGYQPCQLVKRRKNQRFKDHLCPRRQGADVS
jgi:hypothetical protein